MLHLDNKYSTWESVNLRRGLSRVTTQPRARSKGAKHNNHIKEANVEKKNEVLNIYY